MTVGGLAIELRSPPMVQHMRQDGGTAFFFPIGASADRARRPVLKAMINCPTSGLIDPIAKQITLFHRIEK